jgi:hypothetical protein
VVEEDEPPITSPEQLLDELRGMRQQLVEKLCAHIDGGDLALLTSVQGAIDALYDIFDPEPA